MNDQFDELAKGLAQSVTRREAFKKFGVGIAGMVLACFGYAGSGQKKFGYCGVQNGVYTGSCGDQFSCTGGPSGTCKVGRLAGGVASSPCGGQYDPTKGCSFFMNPL
jgi:hypothetical protein